MSTVIILLSDKRSGSTLFQREICKHPDIQTVAYSPHTYLETHHWLKGAVMSGYKGYQGYGSVNNARKYMVDLLVGNLDGYRPPQNDEGLIYEGWEALCKKFAKPVFFEKSPQVLSHWPAVELLLNWLEQTQFNVKIVGLVRNPMAVQYSAMRLFYTDPNLRQLSWARAQSNLIKVQKLLPADVFKLVRYEDLVSHPAETFEELSQFIGVDMDHSMGSDANRDSDNKWAGDPIFDFVPVDEVKEVAQKLGYSLAEMENPNGGKGSWLAKQIFYFNGRLRLARSRFLDRIIIPFFLKSK